MFHKLTAFTMLQDPRPDNAASEPVAPTILQPPTPSFPPHELCDLPECIAHPYAAHSKHCIDCGSLAGTQHQCGYCGRHNHTIHSSNHDSRIVLVGEEVSHRAWCKPCHAYHQQQQSLKQKQTALPVRKKGKMMTSADCCCLLQLSVTALLCCMQVLSVFRTSRTCEVALLQSIYNMHQVAKILVVVQVTQAQADAERGPRLC